MSRDNDRTRVRKSSDTIIAGVAAGVAEYVDTDPIWIRILFVVLALAGGIGVIVYLVLWFLMPGPLDAPTAQAEFGGSGAGFNAPAEGGGGSTPASTAAVSTEPAASRVVNGRRRGLGLGLLLVAVGCWFLLENLGLISWWQWNIAWPVMVILIGLIVIFARFR
ncbi:MAG: PspC domain-containing protein [Candidatus Dormibacteraceae bacterium]